VSETYMVVDMTESDWATQLTGRPFGKFGPFPSKEEAEAWVAGLGWHPEAYSAFPSKDCR
jgi:viroplasmin and RNaseH domain-containing protein